MRAHRSVPYLLIVCILVTLPACGHDNRTRQAAAAPAPATTPVLGDTYLTALPLAPTDVVLQYDVGPNLGSREEGQEQPWGHVPPLTLFADGTLIYVERDTGVMQAHLTADEMQALINHVLALGFERLETDVDGCRDVGNGLHACATDGYYNILRLRLRSGVLHEVTINGYDGPDPEAIMAITQLLDAYAHPDARAYHPTHATLLVYPIRGQPDPLPAWPLAPDWLAPLTGEVRLVVGILEGDTLQTMLAATTSSPVGQPFRDGSQQYLGIVSPWLPGQDYHTAITAYTQRPGIAAPMDRSAAATPVP